MDAQSALFSALKKACEGSELLIALDFDGTLAPLVSRAEHARANPRAAAAIEKLTQLPHTRTALVSGRALTSLQEVAQPPERTWLVASHGSERWFDGISEPPHLDAELSAALAEAVSRLNQLCATFPGTWVENKPAGAALHYRALASEPDEVSRLEEELRHIFEQWKSFVPRVYSQWGKFVAEASVVHTNKGEGISLLRDRAGATNVIFAGDDVTDENGFAALNPVNDVGIKVGDGETAARYRVPDIDGVVNVLEALLAYRQKYFVAKK